MFNFYFFRICRKKKECNNQNFILRCFGKKMLNEAEQLWLEKIVQLFCYGKFKFQNKKRAFKHKEKTWIFDFKSKLEQEIVRFFFEIIFDFSFRACFYGGKLSSECHAVVSYIQRKFNNPNWLIKCSIGLHALSFSSKILINQLKEKIKDQFFIDLIEKHFKMYFQNKVKSASFEVFRASIFYPIFLHIYMQIFDEWMKDVLMPSFNRDKCVKKNVESAKISRKKSFKMSRKIFLKEEDGYKTFRRLVYVRDSSDFLCSVVGSKRDCILIKKKIAEFFEKELKLILNQDKIKIVNALKNSITFLGHRIYKTSKQEQQAKIFKRGSFAEPISEVIVEVPINEIIKRIESYQLLNPQTKKPSHNKKLIHLHLSDVLNYYQTIEKKVLQFYNLAHNYKIFAAKVHYILKYSCALTIALKMKLKTLKKVFNKYGKDLRIKNHKGEVIAFYPTKKLNGNN